MSMLFALLRRLRVLLGPSFAANRDSKDGDTRARATEEDAEIWLSSSHIGFATKIDREERFKLLANYGLSLGGKPDIACVVFRDDDIVDMVTAVELKLSNPSCVDDEDYTDPDALGAQDPIGQAIFYSVDAYHCLARRGGANVVALAGDEAHAEKLPVERVEKVSLPIVTLVAQREPKQRETDEGASVGEKRERRDNRDNDLCFVHGSLYIPVNLGGKFYYQIDRRFNFPTDDSSSQEPYEQAAAIFIKTMRVGVVNAARLLVQEDAVSLCCSPPPTDLELIACPIPGATLTSSVGFSISQGELHRFTGTRTLWW